MTAPRRIATAIALAALAASASGFLRSSDDATGVELFWPMPLVPFHVSDAEPFVPSPTCDGSAGGDPALDAVRAGFSAWQQRCASGDAPSLELVYAGRIPELRTGAAGTAENVVVVRKGWCSNRVPPSDPCRQDPAGDCSAVYNCFDDSPGERFIVALTSVLYEPATGRIVDADIEVNGWDGVAGSLAVGASGPTHGWYFTCDKQAAWSECTTYGQAGCYYMDLQNTITHEAGHFIGLAHPCEGSQCDSSASFAETTMYPRTSAGDLEKRTLSADDLAGLCAIYPDEGGGSGCSTRGGGGVIGAVVALLLVAARRRVREPR